MATSTKKRTKRTKKAKINKQHGPRVSDVAASSPVSTDSLELMPNSRGTEYEDVFAVMRELKPGKSTVVTTPSGVKTSVFQSRLSAARRRCGVEAPKGCEFRQRSLKNGNVAIICHELK